MDGDTGITFKQEELTNLEELRVFFIKTFQELPEGELFDEESDQSDLSEWFAIDHLPHYLQKHGFLITARNQDGDLVGAIAGGKQHPLTWPDGRKVELFILAVHQDKRRKGIGGTLLEMALDLASRIGGKKVIVNSHMLLESSHRFYEKHGFVKMGVLKDYYDNGDAVFYGRDLA